MSNFNFAMVTTTMIPVLILTLLVTAISAHPLLCRQSTSAYASDDANSEIIKFFFCGLGLLLFLIYWGYAIWVCHYTRKHGPPGPKKEELEGCHQMFGDKAKEMMLKERRDRDERIVRLETMLESGVVGVKEESFLREKVLREKELREGSLGERGKEEKSWGKNGRRV